MFAPVNQLFPYEPPHLGIHADQYHAVFPKILKGRARDFYIHYIDEENTFTNVYLQLSTHFETQLDHHHYYYTDSTAATLQKLRHENPEADLRSVLRTLFEKLQLCQRALENVCPGENALNTDVIRACRNVPELEMALFTPSDSCDQLTSQLRASLETSPSRNASTFAQEDSERYYTTISSAGTITTAVDVAASTVTVEEEDTHAEDLADSTHVADTEIQAVMGNGQKSPSYATRKAICPQSTLQKSANAFGVTALSKPSSWELQKTILLRFCQSTRALSSMKTSLNGKLNTSLTRMAHTPSST